MAFTGRTAKRLEAQSRELQRVLDEAQRLQREISQQLVKIRCQVQTAPPSIKKPR
jgi:hypothetical protein